MSNKIYNATDGPRSSEEDPEKIHQEKGSKKRINTGKIDDVGNLHQTDKPTSEYDDSSSSQRWQQQDYEDILLQQHGNFPEEYDIKFPDTDTDKSAAQCLDDSFHNVGLSPAKDFVSDNYAAKSFGHGGGAAAAGGSADITILQPTSPIRNYSSDVVSSNNNFSNSPASLSSSISLNGAILDVALSVFDDANGNSDSHYNDVENNKCNGNGLHPTSNTPPRLLKHKNASSTINSLHGGDILTSNSKFDSGWRNSNRSKLWNKVPKDFVPEKLSSFFVEGSEDIAIRTAADTLHSGDINGWRRPNAFFWGSNSEEVMPFLHGDDVSKVFNHFNNPKHASNWANKYFNGSHGRGTCANACGYSATAVVSTNSDDEIVVEVTKEAYIKYGESEGIKKSHKTDKPITPTPYVSSTFQPTVESLSHDWCASAAMASFLEELNDNGTMTRTISPVKWALDNHLEYRRRLPNMSQEERITFLEKGCAKFIELLVDVLGSVKGGKYLKLLNFGSPLSTKHTGGSLHHYVTINALRSLQTELDKANHNGCLSRDGCIGVFTKMLPRIMMRSITDKSSGIDISELVVALNDMLVVGLPNTTLDEYGEERTLTTEDKERETETVCEDFGMTREGEADVVQLHSISFLLLGYRFELCLAANNKAFLLLPSTAKASVSFHKSVNKTGRATDHVNAILKMYHGQTFHDGTVNDAPVHVKSGMDNSISLFLTEIFSDIDPTLNADRVVHTLVSDWEDKRTPEQREFMRQVRVKSGEKLGKKNRSAWELYKSMTDTVVPTDMTDDMIIMLVVKNCTQVSWVAHKTGPNAANRSVEIAAIESAYRAVVEKRRLAVEEKLVNAELHRVFDGEKKANEKLDIEFRRHDRILAKEKKADEKLDIEFRRHDRILAKEEKKAKKKRKSTDMAVSDGQASKRQKNDSLNKDPVAAAKERASKTGEKKRSAIGKATSEYWNMSPEEKGRMASEREEKEVALARQEAEKKAKEARHQAKSLDKKSLKRKRVETSSNMAVSDGQVSKRQKLKRVATQKESTVILETWFNTNIGNPYPSKEQKEVLGKQTGLTQFQVEGWFERRRAKDRQAKGLTYKMLASKPTKSGGDTSLERKRVAAEKKRIEQERAAEVKRLEEKQAAEKKRLELAERKRARKRVAREIGIVSPKETNRLTCPHCSKKFASQGGLDYHVEKKVCQRKKKHVTTDTLTNTAPANTKASDDESTVEEMTSSDESSPGVAAEVEDPILIQLATDISMVKNVNGIIQSFDNAATNIVERARGMLTKKADIVSTLETLHTTLKHSKEQTEIEELIESKKIELKKIDADISSACETEERLNIMLREKTMNLYDAKRAEFIAQNEIELSESEDYAAAERNMLKNYVYDYSSE